MRGLSLRVHGSRPRGFGFLGHWGLLMFSRLHCGGRYRGHGRPKAICVPAYGDRRPPLSHGPQCVRPAAPNTPNPSSFPDAYSYPNSRTFRFHESAANQERVWQEELPRKCAGQLPRTSGGAYPEIQSRFALSCSRPTSSAVCGRFFRLTYFSRYLTHSHVHRVSAVVFSYSRQNVCAETFSAK